MTQIIVLCLAALILVISASLEDPLVVSTPAGTFRGTALLSLQGHIYLAFVGMPYALPPVGDLRFAKPVRYPKIEVCLIRRNCSFFLVIYSSYYSFITNYTTRCEENVWTGKSEKLILFLILWSIWEIDHNFSIKLTWKYSILIINILFVIACSDILFARYCQY